MTLLSSLDLTVLPAISLEELEQTAALQTRVDRKYVVTAHELADAFDRIGRELRVLEIDGERTFDYRSTYFDTDDLAMYRDAATGRTQRCKVRTRVYARTGTSWLEVKLRDRRGRTSKDRIEHGEEHSLDARAASFLDSFDIVRPHVSTVRPSVATTYERTTLILRAGNGSSEKAQQRVTIDVDVTCRRPDGTPIAGLGDHLIVETKSPSSRPGPFDHALWAVGLRPVPISKYAIGVASCRPDLPANRWRRVLDRYVQPLTTTQATTGAVL